MLSLPHLLLVLFIVLLVFNKRIPTVFGDLGKGIRSFREGLKGDEIKKIEHKDENNS